MAKAIKAELSDVVVKENPADDETLIMSADIGGVSQEIVVGKEWFCNKQQP